MASGGFFRGTSVTQDSRYFNQNKKLLAKMAFPKCFDERVDLTKVKLEVIHQWVTTRITELLGFDDDIVSSLVVNLLEPKVDERLDPRELQIAITGFLEKDAAAFTRELWELLLSAQANATGIPEQLLAIKKRELEALAAEKDALRRAIERKRTEAATPATTASTESIRSVDSAHAPHERPHERWTSWTEPFALSVAVVTTASSCVTESPSCSESLVSLGSFGSTSIESIAASSQPSALPAEASIAKSIESIAPSPSTSPSESESEPPAVAESTCASRSRSRVTKSQSETPESPEKSPLAVEFDVQ